MNLKDARKSSGVFKAYWFSVILPIISIAAFLVIWQLLVVYKIIPSAYLPKPTALVDTFVYKLSNPQPEGATLMKSIFTSLQTSLTGFFVAIIVGVPIGLVMGWYKGFDKFFKPVLEIVRPIPPIALIPLTILLMGIGFRAKAFIIFYAAFVPCVINSYTGIKLTNPTLINVAKTCGATNFQIFTKVGIPSSLLMVFAGIRVGLGASWSALVAAEMLAASSGLGYMIQMGRLFARPDLIVLGMLIIGLIGFVLTTALGIVEKKMAKWRSLK